MITTKEHRYNCDGKRYKCITTCTTERTEYQYKRINELIEGDRLYSDTFGYCTIDSVGYDYSATYYDSRWLSLLIVRSDNGRCFSVGANSNHSIVIDTLLKFFYGDRSGLYVYNDMPEMPIGDNRRQLLHKRDMLELP